MRGLVFVSVNLLFWLDLLGFSTGKPYNFGNFQKLGFFRMKKVVIGMSGGVDSAVSAYLLKKAGFDVIGLFMKNWEDDDDSEYCSSRQDLIDAASAADVVGIDLEAVNFAKEYKERVFSNFLKEYSAGRTPNPDVLCNSEIKFAAFLDYAMQMGADAIATGHYCRVRENNGLFELLRGTDPGKDQSYFLHRLNQAQLSKAMFPVGGMYKRDVRQLAKEIGLPVAEKKDSTGICFIGERPFREFLSRYLPTKPGPIKNAEGKTIGKHCGLSFYTLGQRKGLGIGGQKEGSGEPWFVAKKDLATNTLWVVQGHDHSWLLSDALTATETSWISGITPAEDSPVTIKTRYRAPDGACVIAKMDSKENAMALSFPTPQWAPTPGQSAVLYAGEVCLGGGFIDTVKLRG